MKKFSYKNFLFLLLIGISIAIRLLSSQVYVNSAIERVQMYSQTCLELDKNCHYDENHRVQLEEDASHELNLAAHLLGHFIQVALSVSSLPFQREEYLGFTPLPVMWIFATSIFHPPRV